MDIGTISLVLMLSLLVLLAIGMPLGFASAILAVLVLVMKFEPALLLNPMAFGDGILTGRPGAGPLNILGQKIYGLITDYVLISVPLFIFMASLLERSGIATEMYSSLNVWLNRTRGGIAIVTSIMAVIMAAMSGIIGGEVVLLGLIALPQMLRLGYNQNLAIGTICASGSLGTMIPPSIVLIIYGLITETSIKALFTAAFLPGFLLASFIILYIVIRTKITPSLAPLPDPVEGEPVGREKSGLFAAFMNVLVLGFSVILLLRVTYFTVTGQNAIVEENTDPIFLGTPDYIPWFIGIVIISLALIQFVFGRERTATSWAMSKGLVPPIVVILAVLGSIYMGITGITEAAGMGAVTVLIISALLHKTTAEWIELTKAKILHLVAGFAVIVGVSYGVSFLGWIGGPELFVVLMFATILGMVMRLEDMSDIIWDGLMRTIKSTGTIIWVTIGAAALAGAYTIAGGPQYVAELIVNSEMPTMLVILTMMLILLFMGAFMDWVGIVLLIIPVFLPIILRLPIEEIGLIGQLQPKYVSVWFGVVFCMNMQVSFLSPPFGPAAFYLKSVAPPHISLTDIFKGFLPFICIQILALSVLIIWPPFIEILLEAGK